MAAQQRLVYVTCTRQCDDNPKSASLQEEVLSSLPCTDVSSGAGDSLRAKTTQKGERRGGENKTGKKTNPTAKEYKERSGKPPKVGESFSFCGSEFTMVGSTTALPAIPGILKGQGHNISFNRRCTNLLKYQKEELWRFIYIFYYYCVLNRKSCFSNHQSLRFFLIWQVTRTS